MGGQTSSSTSTNTLNVGEIINDDQEVLNPTEKSALEGLISAKNGENTGKNEIKTYLEDVNNTLLTVEGKKVNIKFFLDTLETKTADQVLTSFSGTQSKGLWSRDNHRGYKDENIALIQLYLCSIGEAIAIDGILGPETEGALKKYWKQDQENGTPENGIEQPQDQVYTFTLDESTKRDDANFDNKETTVTVQGDGDLHIKNDTIDITCQSNADGTYTLTIDGTIYQIAYDQKSSKLTWNKPGDTGDNAPKIIMLGEKTQNIETHQDNTSNIGKKQEKSTEQSVNTITLGGKTFDIAYTQNSDTKTYTKIQYGAKSVDITNEKAELEDIDGRTYTFDLKDFDGKTFGDEKVTRSKEYTVDDKKISLTESNKVDGTFAIKSATYNKIDATSISGDALTFTETNKKTTTQFKPMRYNEKSDYTITLISEVKGPFGDEQTAYSIQKTKDDGTNDVYKFIQGGKGFDMTTDPQTKKTTFTTSVQTSGSTINTKYVIDNFDYDAINETMQIWKEMANENTTSSLSGLKIGDTQYTKYKTYQGRNGDTKVICSDDSNPPQTKDVIFSKNTNNTFDPINIYNTTIVDSTNGIQKDGFGDALQDTDTKKTSLITTAVTNTTLLPSKPPTTNYHGTLVYDNNTYTFTPKPTTVYDLSKTDLSGFGGLLTVSGNEANQTLMFQGYTTTDGTKTLDSTPVILENNCTTDVKIGNQTYKIAVDSSSKITEITQKTS